MMLPVTHSSLDAILAIAHERNSILDQLRTAIEMGDNDKALALASIYVGASKIPVASDAEN